MEVLLLMLISLVLIVPIAGLWRAGLRSGNEIEVGEWAWD
jgi:hypothetical protein